MASTSFSFEILPPLKGNGTEALFSAVEKLKDFNPEYINITTHHTESVYRELKDGRFEKLKVRRRPGTIALSATIQFKYGIKVQPHLICSGATIEDIEYELIDLQLLGIDRLLLLRGDKDKDDSHFKPTLGGHAHTTDLIKQVNQFNDGFFADGSSIKEPAAKFRFGVACYPEKHEEAPNLEMDIQYLKQKQDMGAEFAITQLFYDNNKYFEFVNKAREAGVNIPIIPGIKPLKKQSQISIIPKTFHCDIPETLAHELIKCKSDDDVASLGVEWAVSQCKELKQHGIGQIHFYTMSAVDSTVKIIDQL